MITGDRVPSGASEKQLINVKEKGFVKIILVAVVVILVGIAGYFALINKSASVPKIPLPKTDIIKVK